MIQAEVGGAARVDPGAGVQRPGFMIRDFTLPSSDGSYFRMSQLRGRSNVLVVFAGPSDTMRSFLEDASRHIHEFTSLDTTIVVILPYAPEQHALARGLPVLVLHDDAHTAYRLSGATDESDLLAPVIYLTDRFGEIVSAYSASNQPMPPPIGDILRTLEFMNHQCPECEPPEWPR